MPTMADLEAELRMIAANYVARHGSLPDCVPQATAEAAHWWVYRMQHRAEPHEAPQQVAVIGAKGSLRWMWPYRDRIIATFCKFLYEKEKFRKIIIAAREDGYFWRGDDADFFMRYIEESMKFQEIGRDEYRKHAVEIAKRAAHTLLVSPSHDHGERRTS